VLIFRDELGWTAPEVAEVLESTVASVTSAPQRARATIEQHLPGTTWPAADPAEREVLNRYVAAFEHADMDGLVALLREDAMLRMRRSRWLAGSPSPRWAKTKPAGFGQAFPLAPAVPATRSRRVGRRESCPDPGLDGRSHCPVIGKPGHQCGSLHLAGDGAWLQP
jgi:RNA polymerase sigma-70 factor, ECF subfamily